MFSECEVKEAVQTAREAESFLSVGGMNRQFFRLLLLASFSGMEKIEVEKAQWSSRPMLKFQVLKFQRVWDYHPNHHNIRQCHGRTVLSTWSPSLGKNTSDLVGGNKTFNKLKN